MARILIVEDEPLISMMLGDWIEELGHQLVGPAATVADALALIETSPVDAALLDVNLRNERCDEIAENLTKRSIPFALATGETGDSEVPGAAHVAKLVKPYDFEAVRNIVDIICGTNGASKAAAA